MEYYINIAVEVFVWTGIDLKILVGISATMCHSAEKIPAKTGMPDHSSEISSIC